MAAYEVQALMTNTAKAIWARMLDTGTSFKITHFAIGDRGCLSSDVTIAIPPSPTITDYVFGNVYNPVALPLASGAAVSGVTYPTELCPVVNCSLPAGVFVGPMSAIYLLGTIVYAPTSPTSVGRVFIATVGTRPQVVFAPTDDFNFDVGVVLGS